MLGCFITGIRKVGKSDC